MSNGRRVRRALLVTTEISDSAPAAEKERAVRRRLVATTGLCPCGAVLELPDGLRVGALTVVRVEHDPDCPAVER